jgi:TRAP-type mannitol/chloroaromatic compound transport system permease small subunit
MDLFYERFSPRKKAISLVCGSLLFFIFTGVMLWQGTLLAIISTVQRETSSSSWAPPLYPTKWILTVGVFFFILQGIAQFISNLFVAITGKGALHE